MTRVGLCCSLAAGVLTLAMAGCGKSGTAEAPQALQQSFQTAEPEVKQAIQTVSASLEKRQYAEATRALAPIIERPLTEAQKQAVGVTLHSINQAIAQDPGLDTKEMYEMRAKMFRALQSGPRF